LYGSLLLGGGFFLGLVFFPGPPPPPPPPPLPPFNPPSSTHHQLRSVKLTSCGPPRNACCRAPRYGSRTSACPAGAPTYLSGCMRLGPPTPLSARAHAATPERSCQAPAVCRDGHPQAGRQLVQQLAAARAAASPPAHPPQFQFQRAHLAEGKPHAAWADAPI
jgi:hypothetical protein